MGRLRFLIAIPAIAALAIMGATGASAAPVHQAAHARAMTATSSGADPWEWENENGLWITGTEHGEPLVGSTSGGNSYTIYPQILYADVYYYSICAGTCSSALCWNTIVTPGEAVGIDSCPAGDENEWFAIPASGTTGYIRTFLAGPSGLTLCVTGEGSGNALQLETCTGSNRQLWTTKNVTT
jgi:hypothetical protein